MKYEVMGFKRVEYTRKSDGKPVSGYNVYLVDCEEIQDGVGHEVLSVWLNCAFSPYKPDIGDIVRPVYNRYGRVEDLVVC